MNPWWLLVPVSYVVGAFPTAHLIAGTAGHDPTTEGSGNPGASNVYRVAGARAGVAVLFGDILKGLVPALVGLAADGRPLGLIAGLAAMIGHIAPVTRLLRGGKGVATLGGTTMVMYPLVAATLIAIWLVIMRRFKTASLGSLVMVVLLPAGVAIRGRPWWEIALTAAAAILVILRHRQNIGRLLHGDERLID